MHMNGMLPTERHKACTRQKNTKLVRVVRRGEWEEGATDHHNMTLRANVSPQSCNHDRVLLPEKKVLLLPEGKISP